jgi:hypothetical protein
MTSWPASSPARRLESRVAWTQLAALAEFAARRPGLQAGTAAALGPGRRRVSSPLTSWPPSCG